MSAVKLLLEETFAKGSELLDLFNNAVDIDGPSSFRVETNGDNRWWS